MDETTGARTDARGGETVSEEALSAAVRSWARRASGGDEHVARTAVEVALWCYRAGTGVPAACRAARALVDSRSEHPTRHTSPLAG